MTVLDTLLGRDTAASPAVLSACQAALLMGAGIAEVPAPGLASLYRMRDESAPGSLTLNDMATIRDTIAALESRDPTAVPEMLLYVNARLRAAGPDNPAAVPKLTPAEAQKAAALEASRQAAAVKDTWGSIGAAFDAFAADPWGALRKYLLYILLALGVGIGAWIFLPRLLSKGVPS